MKWIVQKNLPNRTFEGILSCLDNTGRDVTTVQFTMDDVNLDLFDVLPCLKDYFEPDSILNDRTTEPTVIGVFGSVAFIEYVAKHVPSIYCPTISSVVDQYDFMKSYFGDDYLNHNAEYVSVSNLERYFKLFNRAFIKPLGRKTFPGMILTSEDFQDPDKKSMIQSLKEISVLFNHDIKHISKEMRFWVIDGEIVTHSTYVIDGLVEPIRDVPQEAIDFAKSMAKKCPLFAYTLDIAEIIEDGRPSMKVIEINCINSSGTYDADESAIIKKMEEIGTLHSKDSILIGDLEEVIQFKDCDHTQDIEVWSIQTPFHENFLKWFADLSYEPMVLLLEEGVSWYKLPLSKVTNELVARCDPGMDSLVINNPDIRLLYKLAWE